MPPSPASHASSQQPIHQTRSSPLHARHGVFLHRSSERLRTRPIRPPTSTSPATLVGVQTGGRIRSRSAQPTLHPPLIAMLARPEPLGRMHAFCVPRYYNGSSSMQHLPMPARSWPLPLASQTTGSSYLTSPSPASCTNVYSRAGSGRLTQSTVCRGSWDRLLAQTRHRDPRRSYP